MQSYISFKILRGSLLASQNLNNEVRMRHKLCKWVSSYVTDFYPIKSLVTKLVLNVIKPERPSRLGQFSLKSNSSKPKPQPIFSIFNKVFQLFFLWLIPLPGLRPSRGYIYQESTISFNSRIIKIPTGLSLSLGLHISLVHGLYWITTFVSVFYIPWNLFNWNPIFI